MDNKKNKFEVNSRYFTIAIYCIVSVFIMAVLVRAVFFWDVNFSHLSTAFLSAMSPFLIGILIAFLINPLVSDAKKGIQKVFPYKK